MTKLTTIRRFALAGALLTSAALVLSFSPQAASSAAAPKPSVYTGTYPQVSTTFATLKGVVNPHGTETSYVFQYGTTTAYGAQTSPTAVGNGTTEVKVSQPITGLQPYTTYHYRLVATSAAGTTDGLDASLTTKKIPLTFKIAATPDPVVFGNSLSVGGVLTGTEAAGQRIVLQANPFPYRGIFREVSRPTVTNVDGSFSFPVANLLRATQFRVVATGAQTVNSGTILEQVAARVSLHLGSAGRPGFAHMYGAVEPSEVGASVSFQLLSPDGIPLNIGWTKVGRATNSASRFSRNVRLPRRGFYRAVVHVNNGMQVPGYSRALLVR